MGLAESFIPEKIIPAEIRRRLAHDNYQTVAPPMQSNLEADGWVLDHKNKMTVVMRKKKQHDIAFEDRVWALMAKMHFPSLNAGRSFTISYGSGGNEKSQIDVFAADDEAVLIIECKSTAEVRTSTFKTEVEAIQGTRAGILASVKKEFPNHKVRFLLITQNFAISKESLDRIASADILHLDEDAVEYYLELADHLGRAARFQLLGSLFAGMKIPGINSDVAAIQGRMGGHTYYSFSIEPGRLLKLGYVLHRHKANSNLMPTYQRLIKKTRLKNVSNFVDGGGFFPNSIILNIEAGKRGMQFDRLVQPDGPTRMGILHLPQTYRAAYVIDGQHRLYGYAGSDHADSELIPVIAFVDLSRPEQVRLFMQINENQQPVPKNLQNTLNADLLWDSGDLRDQAKALRLRTAQHLGESKSSPLYGRVLIGENKRTALRSITIESIGIGLDRGAFIGRFTKSEVREPGTFYKGSNDATFESLTSFLDLCFGYIREGVPQQFALGNAEGGFVFVNNGIEALLRIFSDVVEHLQRAQKINPRDESPKSLFEIAEPYLLPVVRFLLKQTVEEGAEFRRMYGSAGRALYWRRLQIAIQDAIPAFEPAGLAEYIEDQKKEFNTESFNLIRDIEEFLNKDIRTRLEDDLGAAWFKKGVPIKVYEAASALATQKNRERDTDDEIHPWSCLHLIDYKEVLSYDNDRWVRLFEMRYTRPGDEKKPGGWKARANWIAELNRIRNENSHVGSVSVEEYEFLVGLGAWLDEDIE
jgi:DNA sulfur modification protein DndB